VPFRKAHHTVGHLVHQAEQFGTSLDALPHSVLVAAHPDLGSSDALAVLSPPSAVERRSVFGGPARQRVVEAIAHARQRWAAEARSE
jgi:argininosuccinate lyase